MNTIHIIILLLIQAAIVIPFAIHQGNVKRVLLIACLLEVGKYLFLFLFVLDFLDWLPGFATICFFYMVYLAEWITTNGNWWPGTLAGKIAVLCVGVAWNLTAAYLLAWRLPGKSRARMPCK